MGAKGAEGGTNAAEEKAVTRGPKVSDTRSWVGRGTLQRREATPSARGMQCCSALTAVVQGREEVGGPLGGGGRSYTGVKEPATGRSGDRTFQDGGKSKTQRS